jgi:hypothetical protein
MADFKFNDIETLQDAKSIANNFADNIVPDNGIAISSTTTASRNYENQTLVSTDLTSAASGKELLSSDLYTNMFNLNMNRESLSSLSRSIFSDGSLKIKDNELGGQLFEGTDAALRLATSGSLGKKYNEGLAGEMNQKLLYKYNSSDGTGTGDSPYETAPDAVSADGNSIALFNSLTEQEKKWYVERGMKLKSYSVVADSSYLTGGFNFDIPDDLTYLGYDTGSRFPDVINPDKTIPKEIIEAPSQKAYISACLIELLISLASKNYSFIGGLGAHRGSQIKFMGPNNTLLQSGTAEKKSYITDHAFGRGFDFDRFNSLTPLSNATASEYETQLDSLLSVINTIPSHLLPDYIKIGNHCSDDYVQKYDGTKVTSGPIIQKYSNLKYITIDKDGPGETVHRSHIHISFSAFRGGRYAGKDGFISLKGSSESAPSTNTPAVGGSLSSKIRSVLVSEGVKTKAYQEKSFLNDTSGLSDLQVFELLYDFGNFNEELSALFTALSWRESSHRPYTVNKSGFYGLWQVGSRKEAGGSNRVELPFPKEVNSKFWRLAYKDWAKDKINESNYDATLKRVQTADNTFGISYYNPLVWVPKNQIALLRSKLSQFNYKTQIKGPLGNKNNSWIFSAWGETFLTHGWIGGVSFWIAADVYKKATGYDVSRLQNWLFDNTPRDSRTRAKDSTRQNRSKLEVWTDLSLYTGDVMKNDRKELYLDIYD